MIEIPSIVLKSTLHDITFVINIMLNKYMVAYLIYLIYTYQVTILSTISFCSVDVRLK